MLIEALPLWAEILVYGYVLGGLYVYTKISKITIFGRNIIREKYKILIALFFPFIFALGLVIGAFIIAGLLTYRFTSSFYDRKDKIRLYRKIYK